MNQYASTVTTATMPRLPLEGSLDLTYRCNNNCRHCWLWVPDHDEIKDKELTFDEIRSIVDQARAMGCRRWNISGGEPLLRPDFPEIFTYITDKSAGYTLNSNGTLITKEIARLLTRKGVKLIALYGATADVYDHVTRHRGGFEMAMQGFRYLKEAGAGFIVQLIPMQANWHQWGKMLELAKKLSPHWRIGAPWLWLSYTNSPLRSQEIEKQRLTPADVIALDNPDLSYGEKSINAEAACSTGCQEDDRLFAACIEVRRNFHIDPYGGMTWCSFIKDPNLRYDLRKGNFREAWENFIPACTDKVRGNEQWREKCGSCDKRMDCRWCAVYAYLETGSYTAPIPYLCRVAEEAEHFKQVWQIKHRRYFRIAGITVRLESELDFERIKFKKELQAFAVEGPGDDNVTLRHYFEIPDVKGLDLGKELYRKPPWAISRRNGTWYYRGISTEKGASELHRLATFSADHCSGKIYSTEQDKNRIISGEWSSLALFPTDQIWLAPLLADRSAVLLHSAAAIINGKGYVFVGHSEAGKSTTMELMKAARHEKGLDVEILCDDRNVIRRWPEGWRVHGTWSHGDVTDVSPASAPLHSILFLEQASENKIRLINDRKLIWKRLLATMIRGVVTEEWWRKELAVLENIINAVPCYAMCFDKTGKIIPELESLQ